MIYIKEVLTYNWNYAEYIVTDGKNEIICMCESVPLSLGKVPKAGMEVLQLYAFTYGALKLTKVSVDKDGCGFIKKGNDYFDYFLQGKIIDKTKALIRIGNFIISLEKDFYNGLPEIFNCGDSVEFYVDRIDCTLE